MVQRLYSYGEGLQRVRGIQLGGVEGGGGEEDLYSNEKGEVDGSFTKIRLKRSSCEVLSL